jgi:LacI family transcriptional regulator
MTKRKVSIRDVAKKVGYSTTVVSHAMNGYARINPQTRRQIQAVARQMGYRPNVFARSLATRRSGLIGMVVPGIITSFYPETILPLKTCLEGAGYGLLLMTSDDAKQAERRAIEFLRRRQIDGLIVAPARDVKDASLYDEMAAEGTPVVMLDRWIASARCHSVATDNSAGAEQATRHLIELGHRRIGLVKLRSTCSTTQERTAGYRKALSAAGVAFDAGLVQSPPYNIGRDCYVDGEEALRSLLGLDRPPTALFVLHDVLAVGMLGAAARFGLGVPAELSIVGYDDLEVVKHLPVPLTTVAQDKESLGRTAAELILRSLADAKAAKQDVRLPPALVVRESTAQPAARSNRPCKLLNDRG